MQINLIIMSFFVVFALSKPATESTSSSSSSSSSTTEEGYYSCNHDSSSSTGSSPCDADLVSKTLDESLQIGATTSRSYFGDLKAKLKLNGSFKSGLNASALPPTQSRGPNVTLKRAAKLNASFNSLNRVNESTQKQQNVIDYGIPNSEKLTNQQGYYKSMPKLAMAAFNAKNLNSKIKNIQSRVQEFIKKSKSGPDTVNANNGYDLEEEEEERDVILQPQSQSRSHSTFNLSSMMTTSTTTASYRSYFMRSSSGTNGNGTGLVSLVDESSNVKSLISKFECRRTKF